MCYIDAGQTFLSFKLSLLFVCFASNTGLQNIYFSTPTLLSSMCLIVECCPPVVCAIYISTRCVYLKISDIFDVVVSKIM